MRFLPAIFVLFLPVCVHAARLEVSSLSVPVRPLAEVFPDGDPRPSAIVAGRSGRRIS